LTIGLAPYLLVELATADGPLLKRLARYVSLPNLCGLALLAVIGLFYSAKLYPISPALAGDIPHGFVLSFAPDGQAKAIVCVLVLVFCALEFGLYALLIRPGDAGREARSKALLVTTLGCLLLFPLYRYGASNDFVMRSSILALYILAVFVGRALCGRSLGGRRRIVLMMLLVLGSVTPLIELR